MNNIEFKELRRSLGLTKAWVAAQLGIKYNTVKGWELGGPKRALKQDAIDLLLEINSKIDIMVNHYYLQVIKLRIKLDYQIEICITTYRNDFELWLFQPDFKPLPTTTHKVFIDRLRAKFNGSLIKIIEVKMDKNEYLMWLNGRSDSSELRSAWGTFYIPINKKENRECKNQHNSSR